MVVSAAEPVNEDEDRKRLRERIDFNTGVGGSVFGGLTAAALGLLPSTTRVQKLLIFLACAALATGILAGVGAWRNGRRFTVMAVAATVAVASFAGLSVATEAAMTSKGSVPVSTSPSATPPVAMQPPAGEGPAPSADIVNQSPSTSLVGPSPSVGTASGEPLYLDSLDPVRSNLTPTELTVRGVPYRHALATPIGCAHPDEPTAEYNIPNTRYTRFQATVLLDDDADDRITIHYFVRIDGRVVQEGDVQYGDQVKIDRPVSGVKRVTLGFEQPWCLDNRGQAVWAEARLSTSK